MSKPSQVARRAASLLLLVVLLAPLALVAGIYGTRLGLWGIDTGYGLIGLKVVPVLSWIGLGAALLSVLLVIKDRSVWLFAVAAVLISCVMLGGVYVKTRDTGVAPRDVTTDAADAPSFVGRLAQDRRTNGAATHVPVACEGLAAVDSQLAYESVAWALDRAGVTVMGASPFRVDGWTEGAFFGVQHDVTVRIRPGRTDVRVSGRDGLPIGDQACKLASNIVAAMHEAAAA